MPGIKLRAWKCWTFRLSAPRNPFSPDPGSALQDSPLALSQTEPFARNGLSLACNDSRFSRAPFQGQRSRPATSLASPVASAARSVLRSTASTEFPQQGCFNASEPVAASATGYFLPASRLHSPSGLLHPSGSKRSTGFAQDRSAFRFRPISSRSPLRALLVTLRLRIIVPGSLRLRRLAVPQTSWNLIHYALGALWSIVLSPPHMLFNNFLLLCCVMVTSGAAWIGCV